MQKVIRTNRKSVPVNNICVGKIPSINKQEGLDYVLYKLWKRD